jgi:hypothetical protein
MDEPTVELRLYTIMVPARRTKIGQLEQGGNLGMKHGIVGPADGGIILPGIARHLSHPQITPRFFQVYLPVHTLASHARGFTNAAFPLWRRPEHGPAFPLTGARHPYARSSENAPSSALASCRSTVSKPSVNQP